MSDILPEATVFETLSPMTTGNFLSDVGVLAEWFDLPPREALWAIVNGLETASLRNEAIPS